MQTFNIKCTATISGSFNVEAETEEEALERFNSMMVNESDWFYNATCGNEMFNWECTANGNGIEFPDGTLAFAE